MNRDVANSFIVAIRLYHTAIGMLYTEPEFSYLLLVTCLEAISSAVEKDYRPDDQEAFLDSRYPGWRDMSGTLLEVPRNKLVELLLSNERFTFRKLEKFVEDNLPDSFWSEVFDDAKPHRIVPIIGPRDDEFEKEHLLRLAGKLEEYEKIDKANLGKTLRNVYNARSSLVHEGKRFPASIVVGHFAGIPAEALDEIMTAAKNVVTPPAKPIDHLVLPSGDKWVLPPTRLDVPPLQTFERLVSRTLTNYLLKA